MAGRANALLTGLGVRTKGSSVRKGLPGAQIALCNVQREYRLFVMRRYAAENVPRVHGKRCEAPAA